MNKTKEDKFAFWNELSNLVANHTFSYIDNEKNDAIISSVANETYKLSMRDDIAINMSEYFLKNDSKEKYLICSILEDMLFDENFIHTQLLNSFVNKKITEDALSLISVQLSNCDYEYPSDKNYSHVINDFKHKNDVIPNIYKQKRTEYIKDKYINYTNERSSIHQVHNNNYNEIIYKGLDVWKDSKNLNLYYRIKPFEEKIKTDKIKLSNYLSKILQKHIDIYDSTNDVIYPQADYLIISLLPIVKMDFFNPFSDFEFPHIANNMFYRNTFQYTNLLRNRLNILPLPEVVKPYSSVIENFIRYLSHNDDQFKYIMNWLASFFQTLNKSNIALVLIGDVEATDILISKVIKPIFALKKEYFCTIDDDTLKKLDESTIKDKIFYHIAEISTANAKDKKTSKLVREILKLNGFTPEYACENDEIYIFGQLLVTSSKANVYPFLKDSYSHCTVFKVNSLDAIIKNLNIEPLTFDNMIQYDLNNFASILAKYPVDYVFAYKVLETEDRYSLAKIIDENTLDKNIQNFIDAIISKNIGYFKPIKAINSALYNELIHNFKEGMIARQELLLYFEILHQGSSFFSNKDFLKILKKRDSFFDQSIDKHTTYNGKKRYRIL
jgi:hypothetical protein